MAIILADQLNTNVFWFFIAPLDIKILVCVIAVIAK